MKVLVVYCHPDPTSYVAAVRDAVRRGLVRAAHDVRTIDLYAEGFEPRLSGAEHDAHFDPGTIDASIQPHIDALRWCETLVLVYPTWWSGQPAMLKGWFDRVLVRGVAWDLPARGRRLRPRLGNIRRIVVVTTHGSSKLVNAIEGEAGKRTATRSLRAMCNWHCRTRWVALYDVDTAPLEARREFLARVERELS